MAERIAYRILGGIVQRDKTRDLPIRNIEIFGAPFFLATANFWQPQTATAGFPGDAEPVEQLPVYGRSGLLI